MLSFVCSKFIPNLIKTIMAKLFVYFGYKRDYANVWVVSERGTDARDNGYFFFRYLREKHKDIPCVYVIDKKSPDYQKVQSFGEIIPYQSFQHYALMLRAKYLISTHIMGFTPEPEVFSILQKYRLFDLKGKKIFLQHGIIKDNIDGLKYPTIKLDLFICGAYAEYTYIRDTYGHPEGVVQYTGLARYDTLNNRNSRPQILLMPTWRKWLNSLSEQEFVQTEYYRQYSELINNGELHKWLEEYQYEMVFYPHYEMQKFVHLFETNSLRIHIGEFADYDIQTLLNESEILITDYSSVYFDFAYLNKPIIYFQFDKEQFNEKHYARGYFNENQFGPICSSQERIIQYLTLLKNDVYAQSEYSKNQKLFFENNKGNCCDSIYKAILSIN